MVSILVAVILIVGGTVSGQNHEARHVAGFSGAFDQELYENVLDAEQCDQQLEFLADHPLRLQFLDASAKIPSGIMSGNLNHLGDYHQCLGINQLVDHITFQGKYCIVTAPLDQEPINWPSVPDIDWPGIDWPDIPWPRYDNDTEAVLEEFSTIRRYAYSISGMHEPPEPRVVPMQITSRLGASLAVCVPAPCSATQAIQFVAARAPFLDIQYSELFCRLPGDKPWSAAAYVALVIFSVIGLLLIASTTYDLNHLFVHKRDPSEANALYRSFSVYTNTGRLLTFKPVPGALECVDGVRALSMLWVVVGHTHSLTLFGYIHNLRGILDWMSSWSAVWVNSAPITVDTFFLLSGILAVYTVVGNITRARFVRTLHLFYVNRLLRMFPLLAAVVLLQASVLHHVSDGPFWVNAASAAQSCRDWWWAALLHVQNYVNPTEMCLGQTWYLSVDVQLYVVSPLVLVWLWSGRALAWTALAAALLLSLVSSSLYSFLYNFSAALVPPNRYDEFVDYMQTYYINTLARAPPFLVGLAYGYLLHVWRGRSIRISKVCAGGLWAACAAAMSACTLAMYPVMQAGHSAQLLDNLMNAYMRALWALALGWLIVACVHGYGGPVNWVLSLRVWKLPARLSYAVYLLHFPIIIVANGSWLHTHYFTPAETMYRFMSDISLSFVAAFVLCVTIDAPFSTLQKLLLGKGRKRPQKPKAESQPQPVESINEQYIIKTAL